VAGALLGPGIPRLFLLASRSTSGILQALSPNLLTVTGAAGGCNAARGDNGCRRCSPPRGLGPLVHPGRHAAEDRVSSSFSS
jgi:hypothetical protein